MKDAVQTILTIYRSVLLPWAEAKQYSSWTDEFRERNRKDFEARAETLRVDVTGLSDAEAELLGFPLWSKDTGIRLIPLWLYEFLASGQALTCIDGSQVTVGPNYKVQGDPDYIDNDHRGGAIAYGFVPPSAPKAEA